MVETVQLLLCIRCWFVEMHDRLVATYNVFLENGFDDNGVLEIDHFVDLSSPTYRSVGG